MESRTSLMKTDRVFCVERTARVYKFTQPRASTFSGGLRASGARLKLGVNSESIPNQFRRGQLCLMAPRLSSDGFSKSAPSPRTTARAGLSASCTASSVSFDSRSSKPASSAPPPASMKPRS
jgi:hypothetical protein